VIATTMRCFQFKLIARIHYTPMTYVPTRYIYNIIYYDYIYIVNIRNTFGQKNVCNTIRVLARYSFEWGSGEGWHGVQMNFNPTI